MSKKTIKFIAFLAVGVFIFYFLLKNINLADLKGSLSGFDWRFGFLAFGLYSVISVFKALRFNFFLENKLGFRKFLRIIFLYNFWNQILPFFSGDLSYLYLVKKSKKVALGENFSSLITARVFDLFIVALFAFLGLYFSLDFRRLDLNLKKWFLPGALLVSAIFISLIFFNRQINGAIKSGFKKIGFLKFRFISYLFDKLNQVSASIATLKSIPRFFGFFGYSLAIWLMDFIFIWLMVTGAGLTINFWQAVAASTLLIFATSLIPVQTPVNLGTYEGALVLIFMAFGFEKNISVGAGILVHLQNILFAFVLFVFINIFGRKFKD